MKSPEEAIVGVGEGAAFPFGGVALAATGFPIGSAFKCLAFVDPIDQHEQATSPVMDRIANLSFIRLFSWPGKEFADDILCGRYMRLHEYIRFDERHTRTDRSVDLFRSAAQPLGTRILPLSKINGLRGTQ